MIMWDQYQFRPRPHLLVNVCVCVKLSEFMLIPKYYYYYGKRIPIFHHLNKHAIVRS